METKETINLIYNLLVVVYSVLFFFMKVTFRNETIRLILTATVKLSSLFCMLYAALTIFKNFGIIF